MAAPQQSIGHYRIVSKLGEGGMGEVWRATDTRLNREVAIKVLPEAFAEDPMRMGRFAREAQVLASLNHPGIAAIYGVEERALVMELVEGPTLAERIARGKIPLDEALPIATQIAEALEYAHEKGVVHRDLKPANIKITPAGRVKILDFGLAKAMSAECSANSSAEAATLSSPATMAGTILGTAAYMSPEQARGQNVDRRADIWAFGVVLYEMLTGERPFGGPTISDTLAAVLRAEPDISRLPEPARSVIARCLQKDPRERWSAIGDARYALQHPPAPVASAGRQRRWLSAALFFAAPLCGVLAWWLKPVPAPDRMVGRFSVALPSGPSFRNPGPHPLAISPDGSKIVYYAGQHLYLRAMDALDWRIVAETATDLSEPIFSPDGQWIAFFTGGTPNVLQKIAITGGAPVTLCTLQGRARGASWNDGRIVFSDANAGNYTIESVADAGGTPQVLAAVAPGDQAVQPQLFDHGRHLLFTFIPRGGGFGDGAFQLVTEDVGSPATRRVVLNGGADAHVLPNGRLIYIHNGTIFGVAYSASRRTVTGTPVPLIVGVGETAVMGFAKYAVASNGILVYMPGSSLPVEPGLLTWVDQRGIETPLAAPAHAYEYPRISPDGKRIAVNIQDPPADLWIWDTARNTLSRLSFGAADDKIVNTIYAAWTGDGRSIYFSGAGGLHRKAADGTGGTDAVSELSGLGADGFLEGVSPDGRFAVIRRRSGERRSLALLPLQPADVLKPLLADPKFNQMNSGISPDGRWLAYQSDETGSYEIYVRPFPNVDAGRWQVSNGPAQFPVWSRDGRALYYIATNPPSQMMAVAVQSQPAFSAGQPKTLFPYTYPWDGNDGRRFDVAPDGRFLVIKPTAPAGAPEQQSLTVVTNWTSEVAARVH